MVLRLNNVYVKTTWFGKPGGWGVLFCFFMLYAWLYFRYYKNIKNYNNKFKFKKKSWKGRQF